MLSDAAIRRAKASEKDYKLSDSGGLYLLVKANGSRLWRWKYRFGRKEKLLSIGAYPQISLAEARKARDDARALLKEGRDPSVQKKHQAAQAHEHTFEVLARRWHALQAGGWSTQHSKDVLDSLQDDVFPEIGHLPINSIDPPLILSVLKKIEKRPAVETAHRVRQRMSAVFVYAIAAGISRNDPAAIVRDALETIVRGKQPAITDLEEARKILRAVEAIPAHPGTKLGMRLLAITAVRPGTLAETPWIEFPEDLEPKTALWRIPPERMKLKKKHKSDTAREHWVPLPLQAIEVIEVLRKLTSRTPYVFPNTRHAHKPMSENALGYLLHRAGYHSRHVPHGWRSTFSTVMNERYPYDGMIIDLMLAHTPKDKVQAAYNRAEHLQRRRELAQIWADLLLEGMPPAADLLKGPKR